MKKILIIAVSILIAHQTAAPTSLRASYNEKLNVYDSSDDDSSSDDENHNHSIKTCKKNILTRVGQVLLISTAKKSWMKKSAYIEAYDIRTGSLLWVHKQEKGNYIYSYLVVDNNTLIYRSHGEITALDIRRGNVLWKNETLGPHSIHYSNDKGASIWAS